MQRGDEEEEEEDGFCSKSEVHLHCVFLLFFLLIFPFFSIFPLHSTMVRLTILESHDLRFSQNSAD